MNPIPVILFSAWSGTGKTTIIEQLIPRLRQAGLRVAVLKHDAHDFEIDKEGKDSWRFSHAGADVTVISSRTKTAVMEHRSLGLSDVLSRIRDVDVILVEGYNDETCALRTDPYPGFRFYPAGISRRETGKGFRLPPEHYSFLITDEDTDSALPVFSPDQIDALAAYLTETVIGASPIRP